MSVRVVMDGSVETVASCGDVVNPDVSSARLMVKEGYCVACRVELEDFSNRGSWSN